MDDGDVIHLPVIVGEFRPCVIENEALQLTEVILEDTSIVWRHLPIPGVKGHCVDLGYRCDGKLVGVKIWALIHTAEALDKLNDASRINAGGTIKD